MMIASPNLHRAGVALGTGAGETESKKRGNRDGLMPPLQDWSPLTPLPNKPLTWN